MRRTSFVAVAAAAAVIGGSALPAQALTRFSQVSLTSTVASFSVSVSTTVRAATTVRVDQYGVCVRDRAGRNLDFAPKATDQLINPTGTTYRAQQVFPSGTFVYFPCLRTSGSWVAVGVPKTFTVAQPAGASPSPSASVSPSPSVGTSPSASPSPSASSSANPSPSASPSANPSPSASPSISNPPSAPAPQVLFSDDFSGSGAYDHGKWGEWSACTYNGSAAYGLIGCGDRASLDGQGHLVVPASPTQGTSISTGNRFSFTYGTVTARMMVPTEVGYWPAFWLLNNNPTGRPNSATVGETDVIEAYTTFGDGYRRATHNYTPQGTWSSADDPLCAGSDIRGTWHDYSAKIEPGQITFYVDGQQCGPVEKSSDAERGGMPYAFGPDNPAGNWLLLTLAIGGAGGAQKPASADAKLLVDSVTVTAL